jgi:hypothetical protein
MPVDVIVKLAPASPDAALSSLEACARAAGVELAPLHGGTSDPELASYYVASVAPHTADALAARLRACPGVEAAYAKPAGAPPDERM